MCSGPPRDLKRICVFCGAGVGTNPVYEQGARALGAEMVKRKIGLVYGGEQLSISAPCAPPDGLCVSASTRAGSSQAGRWA
jgi:hypothetical protein